MIGTVSGLGYTVPLTIVLVFVALVIGLALGVMFWLTIALSVYRSVQRDRRERVRSDLEGGLLDRVFDPEMDWDEWVSTLSDVERTVLESLLDEYIRELDGSEVERLTVLGEALEIPERSRRQLEGSGEYAHLSALTWLALLERPDVLRAAGFEPATPRERAAVVRLRHETDELDEPASGITIMLEDARTQFTVFGQDTLYRVALEDPPAFLEAVAANYRSWSQPLLVQVLTVCRHLGASIRGGDVSWLTASLGHDNEAVRAAAARALGELGWRSELRDQLFLDRLIDDPSPQVRSAVYRMLARWGDEGAVETLTRALATEDDERARLAGTEALVGRRDRLPSDSPPELVDTWAWSSEHAEFDRVARQRGTRAGS